MNPKGMSQTLALIVAASVLMMTALTVIFLVQGGLGGINQDTSLSSCRGSINAICAGTDSTKSLPATCYDQEGKKIPRADTITGVTGDKVECGQRQ